MMNENQKDTPKENEIGWKICPYCGYELPNMPDLKFCTSCGIDLISLKKYKKIPPEFLKRQQEQSIPNSTDFYDSWAGITKLNDQELLKTEDRKLWSTTTSIGLTLLAIFLMNLLAVIFVIPLIFMTTSIENLMNTLTSPYFLVITSFAEIVLILVPLIYVKKFLRNPTFRNRFALLGFTVKNMDVGEVFKEIFIGLVFSVVGIIAVLLASFIIEAIVELIFGIDIIRQVSTTGGEIDLIILNSDILALISLMLVMIFIIGTSEEILFRGFMQKGLVRTLGKKWGIFITAIVFTLIHLIGTFLIYDILSISFLVSFIISFFPYLTISYLLGLLYQWRSENLIAVMIMHGFYDALTVLLVFLLYSIGL